MAANNKLPSIGVINVGGNAVKILYLGGSTFKLDYDTGEDQGDATLDKAQVDELIKNKQLALTSEDEYRRICAAIDPTTGDTATHYSDGREKTIVEKALGQMMQEDSSRVARQNSEVAPGGEDDPFADDASAQQPSGGETAHEMRRSRPIPQDDPFGPDDGPSDFQSMQDFGQPQPSRGQHSSGMRGPTDTMPVDEWGQHGRQHENLSLKTSPAKRSGIMFGIVLGTVVLCAVLFGVAYTLTNNLKMNVSDIPVIGQFLAPSSVSQRNTDRSNLPPEEKTPAGENQGNGGTEIVVRTDFDPESAVISQPLADSAQKEVAKQFFSAVRVAYQEGKLDQLKSMIAYSDVNGQIGAAYGLLEQQRLQGMTDAERDALAGQYREMLGQRESSHIANHDADASIYCGRIREVRADSNDSMRLYVVMESLTGDHQRICFILQGDAKSGSYALLGIMDPEGYVRMIRAGEIG